MSAPTDLKGLKAQAGHDYLPKTVLIASYACTTLSIGAVKTAHAVKTRRRKLKSKRKANLFFLLKSAHVLSSKKCSRKQKVAQARVCPMCDQINLVPAVSLPSEEKERDPGYHIPRDMVRSSILGKLRMRKHHTNRVVPLDAVPESRTERCSPRFRPGDLF